MYFNQFFGALSVLQCFVFFSDQKYVSDFPQKAFDFRCFIFKPCLTHFNATADSMIYSTVKRLTKRVEEFFK